MADYSTLHQAHYSDKQIRIHNAAIILSIVHSLHPFNSAIDIGCGIGAWLLAASELGANDIKGVDGPWINDAKDILIGKSNIDVVDLSKDHYKPTRKYDIAISIEVAEHLGSHSADQFCKTLVEASDFIVFSAAIPGQGGLGHVNEQFIDYWIEKFLCLHYIPIDPIRPRLKSDGNIYWWLQQNVICFVSYDLLLKNPDWLHYSGPLNTFSYVHPSLYKRLLGISSQT